MSGRAATAANFSGSRCLGGPRIQRRFHRRPLRRRFHRRPRCLTSEEGRSPAAPAQAAAVAQAAAPRRGDVDTTPAGTVRALNGGCSRPQVRPRLRARPRPGPEGLSRSITQIQHPSLAMAKDQAIGRGRTQEGAGERVRTSEMKSIGRRQSARRAMCGPCPPQRGEKIHGLRGHGSRHGSTRPWLSGVASKDARYQIRISPSSVLQL